MKYIFVRLACKLYIRIFASYVYHHNKLDSTNLNLNNYKIVSKVCRNIILVMIPFIIIFWILLKKASISCGTGICSQALHFQSILLHNTAMFRTQITSMCMYITVSNQVERTYSCIIYIIPHVCIYVIISLSTDK